MPSATVVFESLEARQLLAFSAHVNFEPKGAPVPAGYVADIGSIFGDRGNGFNYGWKVLDSQTVDRNSAASPDQRYDTLIHTQLKGADASWEIAVPNGTYSVHLVAGDPQFLDSFYKFNAENITVVNAAPTAAKHWIEGTANVTVTDGRLTITNAAGSQNNKIDFIDITEVSAGTNQTVAAHYTFDEGAGSTAADSSGNGNNASLFNGAAWAAGVIGNAIAFDGINDYVSAPSSASLNPSAAISVSALINANNWNNASPRILQKGLNDNQYRLYGEGGYLKFQVVGVADGLVKTLLPAAGWHQVGATYDGTWINIYIDGVSRAKHLASGGLATSSDPLFIGAKKSNSTASESFNGRIDDVRIYNRGLSGAEMKTLYDAAVLPTITVAATDAAAAEPSNNGTFTITRSGATTNSLTVKYAITGTATSGSDYNAPTGSAIIPAGAASVTVPIIVKDDPSPESSETVILTLLSAAGYSVGSPDHDTVVIVDNDSVNHPPSLPVILEPDADGELVSGFDVHMETRPFSDPDPGQTMLSSDFEIWTVATNPVKVWSTTEPGNKGTHFHFGDGTFQGPQAGQNKLAPDTNYQFRVRFRDNSGDAATNTSPTATRNFRTLPEQTPTAAGWVAQQAGYRVEEVPFTFPAGELDWRLPTNIVFVPASVHGAHPEDPLFYVTELYGTIRVVTNNFTVHTYADNLLNYNPLGPISGDGENGLTGLAVDPTNGDVFATMLYDDPKDATTDTFPKVTRFHSTDGGIHAATQTDILKMPGEPMHQSHIISNITFGPDGKLYVHVGDGLIDNTSGQGDLVFRGKILRMNKDGSAPTDNPHYNAADRGNDGLPDAEDYWYAKGFRNPFGGAWRDADPSVNRPAQHFTVENGPSLDRFSMLVRDRNYLYNGTDTSIRNYNIAYSPTGTFEKNAPDWQPSIAPVNIAFIQTSNFNNSGFPADKWGHAFVSTSGPTHASGPNNAKSIQEWVLNDDGTRHVATGNEPANPREIASYEGAGYATAAGLAAGPDGLYFTTLYPDTDPVGTNRGAKIFRIVYTGGATLAQSATTLQATSPSTMSVSQSGAGTSTTALLATDTTNAVKPHDYAGHVHTFITPNILDESTGAVSPFSIIPVVEVGTKDWDDLFDS